MTYINGCDMGGTLLQQHLGEASRRCTNIQAIQALDRDIEETESAFELERRARDIALRFIENFYAAFGIGVLRGLGCHYTVDGYSAARDGIPCSRAGRIKPALNQEFIEAVACHSTSRGTVPDGLPSGFRVIFSIRASASFNCFSQCSFRA